MEGGTRWVRFLKLASYLIKNDLQLAKEDVYMDFYLPGKGDLDAIVSTHSCVKDLWGEVVTLCESCVGMISLDKVAQMWIQPRSFKQVNHNKDFGIGLSTGRLLIPA